MIVSSCATRSGDPSKSGHVAVASSQLKSARSGKRSSTPPSSQCSRYVVPARTGSVEGDPTSPTSAAAVRLAASGHDTSGVSSLSSDGCNAPQSPFATAVVMRDAAAVGRSRRVPTAARDPSPRRHRIGRAAHQSRARCRSRSRAQPCDDRREALSAAGDDAARRWRAPSGPSPRRPRSQRHRAPGRRGTLQARAAVHRGRRHRGACERDQPVLRFVRDYRSDRVGISRRAKNKVAILPSVARSPTSEIREELRDERRPVGVPDDVLPVGVPTERARKLVDRAGRDGTNDMPIGPGASDARGDIETAHARDVRSARFGRDRPDARRQRMLEGLIEPRAGSSRRHHRPARDTSQCAVRHATCRREWSRRRDRRFTIEYTRSGDQFLEHLDRAAETSNASCTCTRWRSICSSCASPSAWSARAPVAAATSVR